jgi:hypothetical protein
MSGWLDVVVDGADEALRRRVARDAGEITSAPALTETVS